MYNSTYLQRTLLVLAKLNTFVFNRRRRQFVSTSAPSSVIKIVCSACALRAQFLKWKGVRKVDQWMEETHTWVDAVQPSGNIQPRGSDPCIKHGYSKADQRIFRQCTSYCDHTSIVKQSPGIITPGSSLTNTTVEITRKHNRSETYDDGGSTVVCGIRIQCRGQ